ncbi:MAG TPA: ATP-binding protein, partial [Thermoanaerobaculia bacterium]
GGGPEVGARIDSVRLDRRGRVLLGTGAGLAELAGGRIVFIDPPELGRPRVRRIVLGRDGTLYLATPGEGLYSRPPGGAWRRARGSTVPEDDLLTVLEDAAGRVWVGSTAGLLVLDGDRLVRPDARSEERALRIERAVYALVEDPDRRLWIGTEGGFYRWDGARLDHFTVHDGLAGSEANRAAAVVDGAGRLWLGTDGGVSLVRDRGDRQPVPPPLVSLHAVEADGEGSPADRPLDLAYRQNRVSFRVGAVSFRDESRITYRTRLLGHDRDWTVETGPARLELHYSALSPGAYTFEVQARSDRSRWSDVVASAPLTIARPFWLQAWFLGLSALVLVGLGFSGHRFHAQRRYAQRLEREVARRTEELVRAQKLEALGVLAGGIAHDFNNLLTVILGYLSLVQASPRLAEADRDHLEHAHRALGRARELSRRLLTFSQGGAPVTGPVPLGRMIRECADFTSRGSNVRCAVAVPEGLWPAEADEGQLSQVLNNLLINAIQAMPGGGAVSVSAANAELGEGEVAGLEAGRYARVRVDDQGPGIPPDVLPRVFDPFFTTKEGGSGLGLATVHSIVRQHRGTVRVEPAPGGGTRFEVWLPASAARPRPVAVPAPAGETGGGRVLVMDDQAAVRGVLEGMLRHLGYDVVATQDGDEAIASYAQALERREPFDLVILDLTVPGGKGGKETLRELLRLDPDVRAVASSGYADDPVLAEGGHDGFVAALPKPYTLDRLAETLRQAQEHPARPKRATARGA